MALDPPGPGLPERLILLPTLNEEAGLAQTLGEIAEVRFPPSSLPPTVAIIDGHSEDGTVSVAERAGAVVLRQHGRGKGAAVREGLGWARAAEYRSVATLDADATYPAGALPALFDLLEGGRDVVIGVRRPEKPPLASLRDLVHRVGNGLLNYSAAQFSGQPVLDICSGFWGIRCASIPALGLESEGFEIESELFIKAFQSGLRVAQFPVSYRPRVGEAKLRAVRDGSRILLSILRYSLKTPRARAQPAVELSARGNDLHSMIVSLSPERIVVLTSPDRIPEADVLARRFVDAVPQASVATASWSDRASESRIPVLMTPPSRATSLVVVALPPLAPDLTSEILVGVPRTQRYFRLSDAGPPGSEGAPPDPFVRSGFRRERVPQGRLRAWFILGATLEPSWTRRELALLKANAQTTPVAVYRREVAPVVTVTAPTGALGPVLAPMARLADR